ncbi:redoxin family protein [Dysgonomonas sp. HDW5A]|uniref:TlpA family protein disulfide reductase n=1 Tax=Dysgonomonas sp. HDW5A TaxID=2714926 RepID=UPI00140CA875|nr:TlpA family protein disulfide reductase [Dysgonomonas sp. HDW5A]QIK60761.1 redoxin family protein [Dysgonomonas sp. HDW5A]
MKNKPLYLGIMFIILMNLLILSCVSTDKNTFPEPKIKSGTTKVSGIIENFEFKEGEEKAIVKLFVPNPVSGVPFRLETSLNKDGSFEFDVPLEADYMIGIINIEALNKNLIIGLGTAKETKLTIIDNKNGNIGIILSNPIGLTTEDALNLGEVLTQMYTTPSADSTYYKMAPKDFASVAIKNMEKILNIAANDTTLSLSTKNFVKNEYKLYYLSGCLLDYAGYIELNYQNFKTKEEPDNFTPQKPDISYYSFLQYFDLNNPQYIYNTTYSEVFQKILFDNTLNIPKIEDTPIDEWLKGVKTILATLIGSDNGLFYDMLAVNTYISQFENELKPLSEKQIANIKNYFKNKDFSKILLKRNEEIIRLAEQTTSPIIRNTPSVENKELMNTIISQYKGKAVFVDFWATWCGPCLSAMKEFREVKRNYKNKDIVFVYTTNTSSPLKLWEEKIKGIGGEQYYLSGEQWDYLLDSFDFSGIPTYQLYDANGILKDQITGYPGNIKMQQIIDEILPKK